MKKIMIALYYSWLKRQALKKSYQQGIDTILQFDPNEWKKQGVKAIILDFDGVLAAHGEIQPLNSVEAWLDKAIACFGLGKVLILTNCPIAKRLRYLQQRFPGLLLLNPKRPKPFTDGIEQALQQTEVTSMELVLVDDRLLTGITAAVTAEITPVYIKQPYSDFKQRWFAETFFWLLRRWEQAWVILISKI